jgi:hypothetical protein
MAGLHQQSAMLYTLGEIDSKNFDGRSPNRTQADEDCAPPSEMFMPVVVSRMEQRLERIVCRIVARDIRAFKRVAIEAREGEVIFFRRAA